MLTAPLFAIGRLWRIVRVGVVRGLLTVELLLLGLFCIDTVRARAHGLAPAVACQIGLASPTSHPRQAVELLGFFLVAGPVACTLARLAGTRHSRLHGRLATEVGAPGLVAHAGLSVALASACFMSPALASLSGLSQTATGMAFEFMPYFLRVAVLAQDLAHWLWAGAATTLVAVALVYLTRRTQVPTYLLELDSRLLLLDLRGDLYPEKYSPRRANFTAGAISPGTRFGRAHARRLVDEYCDLGPGGRDAAVFLTRKAGECVSAIRSLLLEGGADGLVVSIASTSSRALEAYLAHEGIREVVLSPFEHESEQRVILWLRHVGLLAGVTDLRMTPLAHRVVGEPLDARGVEELATDLAVAVSESLNRGSKTALIVSNVCWATGVRLPVRELIAQVRSLVSSDTQLRVVVDGAHAVGNNGLIDAACAFDAYVFGAHKWLFSGEPVGVLLTRQSWLDPRPVDLWRASFNGEMALPTATVGPRQIAHLHASLELARRFPLARKLWPRSSDLRRRLAERLRGRFATIPRGVLDGEQLERHSFILCLQPEANSCWKLASKRELDDYFWNKGVSVNVIEPWPGGPLAVRTTLPYFVNLRDLDRLVGALEGCVK